MRLTKVKMFLTLLGISTIENTEGYGMGNSLRAKQNIVDNGHFLNPCQWLHCFCGRGELAEGVGDTQGLTKGQQMLPPSGRRSCDSHSLPNQYRLAHCKSQRAAC